MAEIGCGNTRTNPNTVKHSRKIRPKQKIKICQPHHVIASISGRCQNGVLNCNSVD
ncbi:MAG: hypothetical protein ACUVTL_08475 [Thermoproteota archaeon]